MGSPEAATIGGSQRTTGQALVEGLLAHRVDTVFGIPGAQTYPLFDALAEHSGEISLLVPRHEQTCAYMAFGYAQSTGRPGVCSVVPGPGVLNASAALLTALGAGSPVLTLTSEIPTDYLGRGLGHLHEMADQLGAVGHFTKWAANVLRPADAPGLLAEAVHRARSGRPGPTVLAAPWDVLAAPGAGAPATPLPVVAPAPDEHALDEAVEILAAARNPMIMVGGGARDAAPAVLALARHLQAPVVSHRSGRGVVPDSDPLGFSGATGFERWADTDVLLAIGTRQELAWFRWPDRPAGLRSINVDIDPAQHDRLQPTVALTGDAGEAAGLLLERLRAAGAPAASRAAEFSGLKERTGAERAAVLQPHLAYLAAIRDVLPADGFFVEEISQIGFSALFGFPVDRPRRFITAGHQGTLGFGYPTSLGVKAANRSSPVVSVTGDGGFLFGATELATAVQHDLGVVVVVFDNGGFGNVQADQQRIYGRQSGAALTNPDFPALARAFGCDAHRVEAPEQLRSALDKALTADRPALIHVPLPLDAATSPWRYLMPASRRHPG
jgi:acetolactate synthase-1/2/3 large subunit